MGKKISFSESEIEILKSVFDNSIDIIVVKDWDGNFVMCNEIVAKLYGTTPDEMVGKEDSYFTGNKEQAEFFKKNVQQIMSHGKREIVYEDSTNAETGEIRNFKSIKTPIVNSKNEKQIIVVAQDITAEVAREKEINYILSSLSVGTWKWDIRTNKVEWGESNFDVFEVSENDFDGTMASFQALIEPDSLGTFRTELNSSINTRTTFQTTFKVLTPKGNEKYIGARGEVTYDDKNNAISMVGINWDRTKEVETELALDEQKRLAQHHAKLASIGELAAGVGHEINNPLTIAKGFLNYCKEKYTSGELTGQDFNDYYAKITNSLDRIQEIVKGLRAFSRTDYKQIEDFDFIDALEESISLVTEIYKKEEIEIVKKYQNVPYKKIVSVTGNRGLLQQVFMNLLSNAKDAVAGVDEKKISITLEVLNKEMNMIVQDTGGGIAKENIKKVFDPFFTTKSVSKGTGIGLSLVYSTVQEFNGSIHLESPKGEGAKFTISLPVNILSEDQFVTQKNENYFADNFILQENIKVIVADDELGIREIVTVLLESMGCEVLLAENGKEAFELLSKQPNDIDAIISDIKMPGMGGIDLLHKVKTTFENGPRFYLMTGGVVTDFEKDTSIRSKIDGYLYKPFKKVDLVNLLKKDFE